MYIVIVFHPPPHTDEKTPGSSQYIDLPSLPLQANQIPYISNQIIHSHHLCFNDPTALAMKIVYKAKYVNFDEIYEVKYEFLLQV